MTGNTEELCRAVLGFVTEGTYPEESVVAGKFPAAALARELELISKAREQVEVWNLQCPSIHVGDY
jgi:centromere/kinetochore protein ZW10